MEKCGSGIVRLLLDVRCSRRIIQALLLLHAMKIGIETRKIFPCLALLVTIYGLVRQVSTFTLLECVRRVHVVTSRLLFAFSTTVFTGGGKLCHYSSETAARQRGSSNPRELSNDRTHATSVRL